MEIYLVQSGSSYGKLFEFPLLFLQIKDYIGFKGLRETKPGGLEMKISGSKIIAGLFEKV